MSGGLRECHLTAHGRAQAIRARDPEIRSALGAAHPDQIVWRGRHAHGNGPGSSDLDLRLETTAVSAQSASSLRSALRRGAPGLGCGARGEAVGSRLGLRPSVVEPATTSPISANSTSIRGWRCAPGFEWRARADAGGSRLAWGALRF
jgi:hypothetical protein